MVINSSAIVSLSYALPGRPAQEEKEQAVPIRELPKRKILLVLVANKKKKGTTHNQEEGKKRR